MQAAFSAPPRGDSLTPPPSLAWRAVADILALCVVVVRRDKGTLGPVPLVMAPRTISFGVEIQFRNSVKKAGRGFMGRYQNSRAEGGSLSADQKREGEEGRDCNMRRVFVLGMALGLAMATLASCSRGRDVSGLPVGDLDTIFSHGALNEYWLTMSPSDLVSVQVLSVLFL